MEHCMGLEEGTGRGLRTHVQRRAVIENVRPSVDSGRVPIKRVEGDLIHVRADVYADGHDVLRAELLWRRAGTNEWRVTVLDHDVNDCWTGAFCVEEVGDWEYAVRAWVDAYATWQHRLEKKCQAGQDVTLELQVGAALVRAAAGRHAGRLAPEVNHLADQLDAPNTPPSIRVELATSRDALTLMASVPDYDHATTSDPPLRVVVEPKLARFSAWYEFFPRSTGPADRHGTFRDALAMLDYVAELGFDIVYLPPVHPIGVTHRKGPNNTLDARPGDPGSPWAIGNADGGHKSIHPELGNLDDFRTFCSRARQLGLQVALDIAFQASPDHPYVQEHPEWFTQRPDGTIQHAENPPKKYEDIYPFELSGPASASLWEELLSVFLHWTEQGVRVFRVDNPHTKPLRFWEWCLGEVRRRHPDVIFLSEAFARPKLMYGLAKAGFSQSYTYFTWRNMGWEFRQYLAELTTPPVSEFFRPNFWPNTPDILPEHLQHGGRPAFVVRAALAALLSSNWGVYGPAYELMEHEARPGSGEYADNEKYQLRSWDLERPDSLRWVLAQLNRIRRGNPALQSNDQIRFHDTDNDHLLCFSKQTADGSNVVIVIVNLNYHRAEEGWTALDLEALSLDQHRQFQVHDLLRDVRYQWRGSRNYVRLDPHDLPVHVFRVRRHVRGEHEFEYFA
jgi:starch synthase (maltosyl-transferring)